VGVLNKENLSNSSKDGSYTFSKYHTNNDTQQTVIVFALIAAMGLVTVVVVDIVLTMQAAEAAGCRTSVAVNASKGRCFKG
jgi:hypothetical protein